MEDPFSDFEGAIKISEEQRIADCFKGDVETLLFKNFAQYEVTKCLQEEQSGRTYLKLDVKVGEHDLIQLRVLKPSTDAAETMTFIDAEEIAA